MNATKARLWLRGITERAAPGCVALLLPFVFLHLYTLPRAMVFNPTLTAAALWRSAPALVADDVLFAICGGVLLAMLDWTRRPRGWRRWIPRSAQMLLVAGVILVAAVQYRVYAEIGMVPSAAVYLRFLRPDSPYAATVNSYATWQNLAWLLFAVLTPCLLLIVAEWFRRVSTVLAGAAAATMLVGVPWPVEAGVPAVCQHPFRKLPPAGFERPTARDPEVADQSPSFASISGLAHREDGLQRVRPAPGGSLVLVLLESTSDQYLFADGDWRYPNLRRMASVGLRFPNYYAPAGHSNPAVHAALSSLRLLPSEAWWQPETANPTAKSIPFVLAEHGYNAALFMSGCFNFFFDGPLFRGMGWTACQDGDELAALYGIPREEREPQGGSIDDAVLLAHALRWIDQRTAERRPFLALLYTGVPHTPYAFCAQGPHAIHADEQPTPQQSYANQLAYADIQIGRLFDHLSETGFFDHGFLVITADHGEAFGQHPGNYIHGAELYQENVRVPMLIVNPRRIKPGSCDTPGSHLDLAPTLLELVGLPPAAPMEGTSLLSQEGPEMVLLVSALDAVSFGLVDGPYKYIYRAAERRSELYRLDHDPGEKIDLAKVQPELTAAYRRWIKSFIHHELTPPVLRQASPAEREFYEGRRLLRRGQPSAAAARFRMAVSLRPDDAEARRQLGWSYFGISLQRMRLSRWDQAAEQLAESLRWLPEQVAVRAAYADALSRIGRYADAVRALREAAAEQARRPRIALRLAWLLATAPDDRLRDPAAALQVIEAMPELTDQTSPTELDVRAAVLAANGRRDDAITLAERALAELKPDEPVFHLDHPADLRARLAAYRAGLPPPAALYPEPITRAEDN